MNRYDISLSGTFELGPAVEPPAPTPRTITFERASYETHEGSGVVIRATTNKPFASSVFIVPLLDASSTATLGTDYNWNGGTLVLHFAAGASEATATLMALTDLDDEEGDETVRLVLPPGQGDPLEPLGWGVGEYGATTVTIYDVGVPRIGFAQAATSVLEGTGGAPREHFVEIICTAEPLVPVTVTVTADYASGELAFGPDLLEPAETTTFTFGPGLPLTALLRVTVNPDATVEDDESITFTLEIAGSDALLGAIDEHTFTVLNDDEPPVYVEFDAAVSSIPEGGGTAIRVLVHDGAGNPVASHSGLRIPITTAGTATIIPNVGSQDAIMSWPGGIARAVIIPPGQSQALIGVNSLQDTLTETNETIILGIAAYNPNVLIGGIAGAPYERDNVITHTCTIVDDDLPNPVVQWREITVDPVYENAQHGPTQRTVRIEVVNPAGSNINQTFRVGFQFTGQATPGSDYTITASASSGGKAHFVPGATFVDVQINSINDTAIETPESIIITLVNPENCTVGTNNVLTGSVISDDAGSNGDALRPEFYFPSETFGRGPNDEILDNTVPMVIDLGPNTVFDEEIFVTVDAYSSNAVEGVDYEFPSGKVCTISPGSRFGTLPFRALPAGLATTQRLVVVNMVATSHGRVDLRTTFNRWTAVLLGSNDTNGLIPPAMTPPATADYQVYNDRIVDVAHGFTMPLPWPNNWNNPQNPAWTSSLRAQVAAVYGVLATDVILGNGNDLMNGVGIASHLAQKLWIERNNPGKTFNDPDALGVTVEEGGIYYLDPHVRYLDVGVGVRVDVMEDIDRFNASLQFGGRSGHESNNRVPGVISWGDNHTINANFRPGMVRDLWIMGNGETRSIGNVTLNATKFSSFNGRRQFFMDNVHFVDLAITFDGNSLEFASNTVGGIPSLRGTALAHGLIYFDGIDYVNVSTPHAGMATYRCMRANFPAAWDIRNCTGTFTHEHIFYHDTVGPVYRFYNNLLPDPGTGRTMFQLVQRPLAGGFIAVGNNWGPSHGLVACVANETWGKNLPGGSGGADYTVYGFCGYVFFEDNKHRGRCGATANVTGYNDNRVLIAVDARGNEAGIYVHETYPGSGVAYSTRYLYIDGMDIDLVGGQWNGNPVDISGVERCDLGTNTKCDSTTPCGGSRAFVNFNTSVDPTALDSAIFTDPLCRGLYGQGVPGQTRRRTPNAGNIFGGAPGGIRFLNGFANFLKNGCGSSRRGEHKRIAYIRWQEQYQELNGQVLAGAPAAPSPASNLFSSGSTGDYDGFTGTDLS